MDANEREQPQRTRRVILDTDMGPDCDDAGALAILHALVDRGEAELLAVTHCTSNPWGAGCIDAINVYYGGWDNVQRYTGYMSGSTHHLKSFRLSTCL
ncbi:hypothetical protein HQN89_30025 [Paenibacillus frigoriresistens]|uniref:hypothetical protein n=1 Tax=Paenibacillus alginolyticus TaxID=59839 RepID=UPI00156742C2|nr:hypothetical protein [Paenibacillus frigoriresistens]NRF95128.1 hypothetical protein [Paenibacillus frigoriresistens]